HKENNGVIVDRYVFAEPKLRVETDLDGEHLRVAIIVWGRGAETVADNRDQAGSQLTMIKARTIVILLTGRPRLSVPGSACRQWNVHSLSWQITFQRNIKRHHETM